MGFLDKAAGKSRTQLPTCKDCWTYEDPILKVDLDRAAELLQPAGAIRIEHTRLPVRVLVFRGQDDRYYCLRNQCSHMGRRLDPVENAPMVECCSFGCSTYDYYGVLMSGAAKKHVVSYPVKRNGRMLSIDLSKGA